MNLIMISINLPRVRIGCAIEIHVMILSTRRWKYGNRGQTPYPWIGGLTPLLGKVPDGTRLT